MFKHLRYLSKYYKSRKSGSMEKLTEEIRQELGLKQPDISKVTDLKEEDRRFSIMCDDIPLEELCQDEESR